MLEKEEPWLLLAVVLSHFYPLIKLRMFKKVMCSIKVICSKHKYKGSFGGEPYRISIE